jgi:type II pantothenate kinase
MIINSSSFSQDLLPMVCLDIGGTLTKLTFAAKADYPINCETHEDLQSNLTT